MHKRDEEIRQSQLNHEQAFIEYRSTVLNALKELAQAIDERLRLAEDGRRSDASLALAEQAARIAEVRYRRGDTDLQPVLDRLAELRSARADRLAVSAARLSNAAALFKVLAGAPSPRD